jgi:hypothetical protein
MVLQETYPTITPAFGHRFIIDGKDTVTLNRGGAFVKRPKREKAAAGSISYRGLIPSVAGKRPAQQGHDQRE